jgi:hypothetical protein
MRLLRTGSTQNPDWGVAGAPPGDIKVPCQELADLEGRLNRFS